MDLTARAVGRCGRRVGQDRSGAGYEIGENRFHLVEDRAAQQARQARPQSGLPICRSARETAQIDISECQPADGTSAAPQYGDLGMSRWGSPSPSYTTSLAAGRSSHLRFAASNLASRFAMYFCLQWLRVLSEQNFFWPWRYLMRPNLPPHQSQRFMMAGALRHPL
jgi:hypothetical protein